MANIKISCIFAVFCLCNSFKVVLSIGFFSFSLAFSNSSLIACFISVISDKYFVKVTLGEEEVIDRFLKFSK